MMRKIIIFLALLVLFISIGAVSAEGNFTALQEEVNSSTDSIEITQDYVYDNTTDYEITSGIIINKSDFTINGNGYTIDASNQMRIFNIYGGNITINNLNFINSNRSEKAGGAIYASGLLILNNVTFTNNTAVLGGAIYVKNSLVLNNATFTNNTAKWGGSIYSEENAEIVNSTFNNSTSDYAAAIYAKGNISIINSIFENLYACATAGAIGLKGLAYGEIINCTFANTAAFKNGGAIYIDISIMESKGTYIANSTFINSTGDYGGALVQLSGDLKIENSIFANNTAEYDGGAIFVSGETLILDNCSFESNNILYEELFNGGAVYCDRANFTSIYSTFTNNSKNAVYAYDVNLNLTDNEFENNGEAIHCVFGKTVSLNNNTYNNDILTLNDTNYASVIIENSIELELINNTINVEVLPARFDLRDWGWVSSVKDQGDMGACWTFGACGALESALLKATGIEYDFSENNMQDNVLIYSKYGALEAYEGGWQDWSLAYILSWFGVFPTEYDTYDQLGKLSPILITNRNIHVQDAILIKECENFTDNDAFKKAIMKYGSIHITYDGYQEAPYYNKETSAQYQNVSTDQTHAVSLVGWDDNYPASNFLITPPGDGAWIIKNSWNTNWGDNGFDYISYYDTSILKYKYSVGFIIENTENYTANYQTDLGGDLSIDEYGRDVNYSVTYNSFRNELISAVGTYFADEGEEYMLEIYVNDELTHIQNGMAPYRGFHTVKLSQEIPVEKGDVFKAVMTKASIPIFYQSRQHYLENVTFINLGNGWTDISLKNKTVSLKVYTKDLAIYAQDLIKIFKNDSKFEANVDNAGVNVTFEINGGTYVRASDENGTARISINLNPGEYTIKTRYNGTAVENTITVLPTLLGANLVKYFRNASQFFIDLIDGEGNPVTGVNITMNINGVFYNRVTNENGTARLNINLNPGEYILTAIDPLTGLQMSYNITVLPTLDASDLEMTYKDGHTFNVTVLDGQGKPLANASVSFNINGVFYTRYSDSDGIARLNINLMAGKFIITSEYEDLRISNTITIKD